MTHGNRGRRRTVLAVAWMLGALAVSTAGAADVVSAIAAESVAGVEQVSFDGSAVHGVAVNQTDDTLFDVKLRVQASWRWKDEFHPGVDDRSWGVIHSIGEIPPRGRVSFTQPSNRPLPPNTEGHYVIDVSVAGLTRRQVREVAP